MSQFALPRLHANGIPTSEERSFRTIREYPPEMVKLVFCLHRRADVDEAVFHRYWRDVHGPLVASFASALGIRRYVQVHATSGPVGDAIASDRGAPEQFDGVAELWFDSVDALMAAALIPQGSAAAERLRADEEKFIDHSRSPIFLSEEHQVL
jgi:uncharacterized protein (TIGR02118 family)